MRGHWGGVVMQELRFPCLGGHGCLVISDSPRLSSAIRLGGSQSVQGPLATGVFHYGYTFDLKLCFYY